MGIDDSKLNLMKKFAQFCKLPSCLFTVFDLSPGKFRDVFQARARLPSPIQIFVRPRLRGLNFPLSGTIATQNISVAAIEMTAFGKQNKPNRKNRLIPKKFGKKSVKNRQNCFFILISARPRKQRCQKFFLKRISTKLAETGDRKFFFDAAVTS